nr:hypothetical protein [Rhizobium skierniewicense]
MFRQTEPALADPDVVSLLVEKGANVEARDKRGWTPLMMQTNNQENGPDVVQHIPNLIDLRSGVSRPGHCRTDLNYV